MGKKRWPKKRKAEKMAFHSDFYLDDHFLVGQIGKANIWGGPQESAAARSWDLVINATTSVFKADLPKFLGCQELLNPELLNITSSPTLHIAITDRKAPTFPKKWWAMLAEDISKIEGDVLVHCMMGHGRTGLVLCCLFGMAAKLKIEVTPVLAPNADIVVWVRKNYDEPKAVEGSVQIAYIKNLGLYTKAQASDQGGTTYLGYSGNPLSQTPAWRQVQK